MTNIANATVQPSSQRMRQFGLREVAAFVTCLAMTLAIYQHANYGVAIAIVLTLALMVLAWQATRRSTCVTSAFAFAALAATTLAMEGALAWAYGFSGAHTWFFQLYLTCCVLRGLFGVPAVFEALAALLRTRPPAKAGGVFHMGFTGRVAILILWMPFVFSAPLTDLGTLHLAHSIGVEAIVSACENTRTPPQDKPSPLTRLGMHRWSMPDRRSKIHYAITTPVAIYHVHQLPNARWQVDVETATMKQTRVGVWP